LKKCEDADFKPEDFDRLFEFQIYSRNPRLLSADCLYALDVSVKEDLAQEAYYKLLKEGIIIESPVPDIETSNINNKFRHHFSFLPEFGQKRLACVLLAWKREIQRMEVLEEEKARIELAIAEEQKMGGELAPEHEAKLKEIKVELKRKPTSRSQPS